MRYLTFLLPIMLLSGCEGRSGANRQMSDSGTQAEEKTSSAVAPAASMETGDTAMSRNNSKPLASVHRLRNNAWNRVTVERRLGVVTNCDLLTATESRQMTRNEVWSTTTDFGRICWRRDNNPDQPNGTWTTWTARDLTPGKEYDDNLN